MKLRIKGDSLRLRVSPSEMKRLLSTGRIEDTIHFSADEDARFTYALEHRPDVRAVVVRYRGKEATVEMPTEKARAWAESNDVGVYTDVDLGTGLLEIAVEKDWACLDKKDADNEDTFPNPKEGAAC